MKGQGIVEYIVVLGLCVIVIVATVIMLAPVVSSIMDNHTACFTKGDHSIECIQERMDACLKTEQYTKDQCVILIGGK